MELSVLNIAGQETGRKVELNDAIFGIQPNEHAIYLDVKQFLANNRQGTHKSKQRNEISGSTRKLKKQKGTGGARAGGIKNPLFRGGGRVFGPVPRDYSFKLNKKLKRLARKSALSVKAANDMNDNVLLSARNLQYVDVMRVSDLATYNIMRAKSLVFVESSVQGLNEMFNLNEE